MFRSDLTAYIRAYDFLSQIFDYSSEVGLEKRAIFYRLLAPPSGKQHSGWRSICQRSS